MDDDAPQADGPQPDGKAQKAADAKDLHRAVREAGESELDRPAGALFWSGLAAGIAIHSSLIAEGALHAGLPDAPWRGLVAALGYPVGFLVVILGRMQLFTESTITAMLPLVTKPSLWALRRTVRLWAIVLGANLIGTALAAGMVAAGALGNAEIREAMVTVSARILELGGWTTFVNAIPAGFLIAVVAWILPNGRTQAFWIILAITYVIAIAGFSHSIVGADEAFLLLFTGHADLGRTVFGLLIPAILGNLVGGAGLFTLLAHGQVQGETRE
ncbi:formate/nitrite transporter family protein [Sphingomonas parapaucimobilis]|uniref:formate/nitrite transporter family protein n=1 Tax=Sphingomonas parapaucimobilis TaxID=28213 RepID=UPI00321AA9DC